MGKSKWIKRNIGWILAVAAALSALTLAGCSSMQRNAKTFVSDLGGGLNRTVTVYSNTGEPIQSWSGKFDVSESENEVYFDIDGRRVIIHGGIVINEESES